MAILVTGGAGYIGSHTCIKLIEAGYDIVVMDNLSNSKPEALRRVQKIVGKPISFYETDMRDTDGVREIFRNEQIDSVIHFAGLKAVGESVEKPLEYYENNISDVYKRQQQGRIILRNQRKTRQTQMALRLKKRQKHLSKLIQSILFHFLPPSDCFLL